MFRMARELRRHHIENPHFADEKAGMRRWRNLPKVQKLSVEELGTGCNPPICSPAVGAEKPIVTFPTCCFFLFLSAKHLTRAKKHRLVSFPNLRIFQLSSTNGTEPLWSLSKYFLSISTCCLVGLMSITDDPLMSPAQWTFHYYSDYYEMHFGICSFPLIFKPMCIQRKFSPCVFDSFAPRSLECGWSELTGLWVILWAFS